MRTPADSSLNAISRKFHRRIVEERKSSSNLISGKSSLLSRTKSFMMAVWTKVKCLSSSCYSSLNLDGQKGLDCSYGEFPGNFRETTLPLNTAPYIGVELIHGPADVIMPFLLGGRPQQWLGHRNFALLLGMAKVWPKSWHYPNKHSTFNGHCPQNVAVK